VNAETLRLDAKQTPEQREQAKRTAEKIADAFGNRSGFDPLLWAKRPASNIAVQAIVTEAKAGNRVLGAILADLIEAGVVVDGKLSKKHGAAI
jgi:hypothetical protein